MSSLNISRPKRRKSEFMTIITEDQISGKVLDHLGLVAATIDKLGLVDKIDSRLPLSKEKGAKTSMGQRAAAMIMNGLGFVNDRLYILGYIKILDQIQRSSAKPHYIIDWCGQKYTNPVFVSHFQKGDFLRARFNSN